MAGTTINPYRFGGQVGYRRDGTNRNYVRARNLDTQRGRWISRAGFKEQQEGELPYGYVENNPANKIDPSGRLGWPPPPWGPFYGHYCGPQIIPGTLPPINGVDACCQAHDNCWGRYHCTYAGGGWGASSGPCKKCNDILCQCIKNHPCPWGDASCSIVRDIFFCQGGCSGAAIPPECFPHDCCCRSGDPAGRPFYYNCDCQTSKGFVAHYGNCTNCQLNFQQ
jgi:RHS repeat-associated protein